MRVVPTVEEDQVAGVRPDHGAVALYRSDVGGRRIVPEDNLAARPGQVIGTEQQAGQRVGINVALEPHLGSALNVEHDAVPIIAGGHDWFGVGVLGQLEEALSVEPVEPGQVSPHVGSVHSAAEDVLHVLRFAGQDRCAGKLPELSLVCRGGYFLLPVSGETAGQVERCPPES
jgi:hypothetical protein